MFSVAQENVYRTALCGSVASSSSLRECACLVCVFRRVMYYFVYRLWTICRTGFLLCHLLFMKECIFNFQYSNSVLH